MDINAVTNRTVLRILAVTGAFIGAIALAYLLRQELVLVGTAFFLALAINPLVERLQTRLRGRSRGTAVAIVIFSLLLIMVAVLSLLVPPLANQTQALTHDLPGYVTRLQNSGSLLGQWLNQTGLSDQLKNHPGQLFEGIFFSRGGEALRLAKQFFTSIVLVLTVITLTVFMLVEGLVWVERFWSFIEPSKRQHQKRLADQMYQVIVKYVTVNLLFGVLSAFLCATLLFIFHIPFAIPISLAVGIFELVPLIGPLIGGGLVVAICLFNSAFDAAIGMTLFFLIYQHVKGNFLHPLILGRTIDLSPLMIFISVIMGVSLGGVVGALVAIPVGGCLQILLKDYLLRHQVRKA